MPLSHLPQRIKRYLREHGWRVGIALGVHRLLVGLNPNCGLYWYRFYRQPLRGTPDLRANANLQFRWIDEYEDMLAMLPRPVENVRARFDQNVQCLVATRDEEFRACAWFAFDRFEEDEVRCTFVLPAHAVWDFDIFVFPEYRIGRLFVRLWQEANRKLTAEGHSESISRISLYNPNSIGSHEKLGAKPAGSALFLKLWDLQIMLSSLRPRIDISLRRTPRIEFESG